MLARHLGVVDGTSVHPPCRPARPDVGRVQPRREAEAAGEPPIEAGDIVQLRDGGVDGVDPPVAARGKATRPASSRDWAPAWIGRAIGCLPAPTTSELHHDPCHHAHPPTPAPADARADRSRRRRLEGAIDGTVGTERVTSQRVAVAAAAAILGVSVVTVRQMIKRGQLEAERVLRPQGSAYLVTLPASLGDGTGDRPPTELLAAWSTAILAPLVAELAESRRAVRRSATRPRRSAGSPPSLSVTGRPSSASATSWLRNGRKRRWTHGERRNPRTRLLSRSQAVCVAGSRRHWR